LQKALIIADFSRVLCVSTGGTRPNHYHGYER
jgi:hypothetical protein